MEGMRSINYVAHIWYVEAYVISIKYQKIFILIFKVFIPCKIA